MKSFLKKMNRGVALAIALLAGLIIFFIADNAVFAKEEPLLKDWLEEYLQACEQVNLLPEEYRESGKDVPNEVIEAKTQELKDFVEKYFTEFKRYSSVYYTSSKQQMILLADAMFKENKSTGSVIKDLKLSLVSISSIQKQGTNAVKLIFNVNMSISASNQARHIRIAVPAWSTHDISRNSPASSNEIQEMSNEYRATITLFKESGEWKIAETDGIYLSGGGGANITYSYGG